jgi:sugar phosphate permease
LCNDLLTHRHHLCPPSPPAGIPLSIIVKDYGWNAYFATLVAACVLALVLLSPMMNLRSHVQRQELRAARKQLKGQ